MPTGTADSADYTVVGVVRPSRWAPRWQAVRVEIEVRGEDDDVGMESLMFDAVVSGDSVNGPGTRPSPAVLSLYIEDATAKKLDFAEGESGRLRGAHGRDCGGGRRRRREPG